LSAKPSRFRGEKEKKEEGKLSLFPLFSQKCAMNPEKRKKEGCRLTLCHQTVPLFPKKKGKGKKGKEKGQGSFPFPFNFKLPTCGKKKREGRKEKCQLLRAPAIPLPRTRKGEKRKDSAVIIPRKKKKRERELPLND